MKFYPDQIVLCELYGHQFYKVIATKDQPYERQLPARDIVRPIDNYEYVIMPFQEILEDGATYWSGEAQAMEDWLTDATEIFAKFYSEELNKKSAK